VQPFYEGAVSDLDRSMHRSLWVYFAHGSLIEGSDMTKNMVSGLITVNVEAYKNGAPYATFTHTFFRLHHCLLFFAKPEKA